MYMDGGGGGLFPLVRGRERVRECTLREFIIHQFINFGGVGEAFCSCVSGFIELVPFTRVELIQEALYS